MGEASRRKWIRRAQFCFSKIAAGKGAEAEGYRRQFRRGPKIESALLQVIEASKTAGDLALLQEGRSARAKRRFARPAKVSKQSRKSRRAMGRRGK